MPAVDSTGSPFAECRTDATGPDLEGRFFWANSHNQANFRSWVLVSMEDRTTVVGRIKHESGWYSRDYRVIVGPDTAEVPRSRHETWTAAAHMLAAVVMERPIVEGYCISCCETRIDMVEVYNHGRPNTVCSSCIPDRYEQCGMCERIARPLFNTRSNGRVCSRHSRDMSNCTMCQTLHRDDEEQCCEHRERCYGCNHFDRDLTTYTMASNDTSRNICDRCISSYEECESCESMAYRGDLHRTLSDGSRCYSCFDSDEYRQCRCGTYYIPDEEECCDEGGFELIRNYSYKPQPVFHGQGKTFLGMEVEIITPSQGKMARMASNGFGDTAILKHDGSVSGGFEIVTHPMSYEWAMANFAWGTFKELADAGAYASDDCGIHVHVSKAGFSSADHDHRWYLFIHRNKDEVQRIARRSGSSWAAFDAEDRAKAKRIAQKKDQNFRRYAAINSIPAHTYEMRVFASSLDVQQIQAAMGLVSATVEYARQLTARKIIRDNGWAWSSFARWVESREEYSPLIAEMKRLHVAA